MKKIITIALAVLAAWCTNIYAAANNSPVGYWKTIDDVTGKPKAIIQITEQSNELNGRIIKIFPSPGKDQNEVCEACKGARHNQRIVGMTILNGLKPANNNAIEWSGGEILDPKNGKTYHCYIQLRDNGQKLTVRGYFGLPMFGRTQTWLRVSSPNQK